MNRHKIFVLPAFLLSIISILWNQNFLNFSLHNIISLILSCLLTVLVLIEVFIWIITENKINTNTTKIVFFVLVFFYLVLFSVSLIFDNKSFEELSILSAIILVIFVLLKANSKSKKIKIYFDTFFSNPARTIILSFVFVILTGAILLMMGFTSSSGVGLSFIDSIFTATSAVCVTGLIVVDTATYFSFWGQLVILVLIQIGGLGIMILSYFTLFVLRRRVSLQDKMLLSYMLSEDDTTSLNSSLSKIVLTTFIIEGIGALVLFLSFLPSMGFSIKNVWYSIFHSISAFCNGGFGLWTNSLEGFRCNYFVTLTISFLIILGGISFSCIINLKQFFKEKFLHLFKLEHGTYKQKLSLNSKIVLKYTAFFLIFGTLVFYAFEFNNTMKDYGLGEQYLASFFQSVTMRTAGFNSVPYNNLRTGTYIVLCVFMFVGAASGSTAGGIKINTLSVIISTVKSYLRGEKKAHIENFELDDDKVIKSFIIFFSGVCASLLAVIILSITENAIFAADKNALVKILFEVFSAIGTAGVSSGITSSFSVIGKIILVGLMFWGRLGAMTILSAAGIKTEQIKINLPQADISIG